MLPKIIVNNKTVSCRLEEYQHLLEDVENPCFDIIEVWASIFEELTIIGVHWKALWILSEENCKHHDLVFPTAVIVEVNDFYWRELLANVTVIAVQEDIVLPSSLDVPVIELHPIRDQEYDTIELRNTADWLDRCRYFFKNLWYPWDAKINVSIKDWCQNHLENRLFLQSDMKNGVFSKPILNYLKSLLLEAQNLNYESRKGSSENEDERLTTVKRYIRRKIIKTELDLFEKPELRQGIILLKTKEKHLKTTSLNLNNPEARLVWMGGSCDCLLENLKVAQTFLPKDNKLKMCASFQEALDASSTNDVILLSKGVHVINKFKGIEGGGSIKGLVGECEISPDLSSIPRAILMECSGVVHLENITITNPSGIVVQVYDGTIRLKNCRLVSQNVSTSKGIVVVSGSKLLVEDCEFIGFGTGIVLQSGTQASILRTKIRNCSEGIKVTDDTSLTLNSVDISLSTTFGIRLETKEMNLEVPVVGDINLLTGNKSCKINCDMVTFAENRKGNVVIKKPDAILSYGDAGDEISPEIICISDDSEFLSGADSKFSDDSEGDLEEIAVALDKAL